jgi:hypothetical protein
MSVMSASRVGQEGEVAKEMCKYSYMVIEMICILDGQDCVLCLRMSVRGRGRGLADVIILELFIFLRERHGIQNTDNETETCDLIYERRCFMCFSVV